MIRNRIESLAKRNSNQCTRLRSSRSNIASVIVFVHFIAECCRIESLILSRAPSSYRFGFFLRTHHEFRSMLNYKTGNLQTDEEWKLRDKWRLGYRSAHDTTPQSEFRSQRKYNRHQIKQTKNFICQRSEGNAFALHMTRPDDVGASTRESCNNEEVSDEDSNISFYNETAISNSDATIVIANETEHTDASESNGFNYKSKKLRKPITTETKSSSEQKAATNSVAPSRWEANDFENDRRLLKLAIARQNNMVNLQQRHRKYVLDHGFARNRRPLMHDLFKIAFSIGGGISFLILGGAGKSLGCEINIAGKHLPWRSKIFSAATQIMVALNIIHYWLIGVATPLVLLTWAKFDDEIAQYRSDETVRKLLSTRQKMKMQLVRWLKIPRFGPMARILDEYSNACGEASTNPPSVAYSTPHTNPKSSRKDTGNFVLCLLENWSSTVIGSFLTGMCTILCSSDERRLLKSIVVGRGVEVDARTNLLKSLSRLIIRLGATASLYQYPSLLFELRRNDQPRPLSRSTTILQSAIRVWLRWFPLGVTTDLAVVIGSLRRTSSMILDKRKFHGVPICSILSVLPPILHIIALSRIVQVSKSTTDSLSKATSFPETNGIDEEVDFDEGEIEENGILAKRTKAQWRYQLRWRSPQRLIDLLRAGINYFFTGHNALITEIDDFKKQPIRFNEFSTEGTFFLTKREKKAINRMDNGDFIPHADAITESLSLIFRDRGAAIANATRSRSSKHEESFKKKEFEDLLGIAIQQTFGIGVSYDFDHFDPPSDGEEISIHQLRARMAKSGIRRKKELEKSMNTELEVLQRLRDNVITNTNRMQAENEVQLTEEDIQQKYRNETDRIKKSLLTLIPTNAEPPAGKEEMYENPIIVARYADLNAPINRKDLKATVESAPDSLELVEEYVRREYGEKAAEAYREEELLSRQREKEVRSKLRERCRKLDDKDEFQGNDSNK